MGLTIQDGENLSLLEHSQAYAAIAENDATAAFTIISCCLYAPLVLAAIALLLSLFYKSNGTTIFSIPALLSGLLLRWDFADRGVLPTTPMIGSSLSRCSRHPQSS